MTSRNARPHRSHRFRRWQPCNQHVDTDRQDVRHHERTRSRQRMRRRPCTRPRHVHRRDRVRTPASPTRTHSRSASPHRSVRRGSCTARLRSSARTPCSHHRRSRTCCRSHSSHRPCSCRSSSCSIPLLAKARHRRRRAGTPRRSRRSTYRKRCRLRMPHRRAPCPGQDRPAHHSEHRARRRARWTRRRGRRPCEWTHHRRSRPREACSPWP